ncbi:MAG: threonine/serine dehydratase [Gemmatimonadales bacterium]
MRTLDDYAAARTRIAQRIHYTPLVKSTSLGQHIGAPLYLKCENLQKTGSFKVRGILNKLLQLDGAARARGVITISAGNAAQAVAWGAREIGTRAVVVMPADASPIKAEACRGYGAEVVLHGDVSQAFEKVHQLEREENLTFVHPFDDLEVVTGHASAGLEIMEQLGDGASPVIVVPIGGGGLISGTAAAVKLTDASARVFGVEPEGADTMRQSLAQSHAVRSDSVHSIAHGLTPPMAGEINYEYVKQYVEEVVVVSDVEIIAAMEPILTRTKLVVEPSGAAAVAALLAGKIPITETDRVVAVLSGGNVEMEELKQCI